MNKWLEEQSKKNNDKHTTGAITEWKEERRKKRERETGSGLG